MKLDKEFLTKDIDEKTLRKVLQIILSVVIVIVAFVDIETIYAYNPNDLYALFQFLEIKHIAYLWASLIFVYIFLIMLFGNVSAASTLYLVFALVLGIAERYFRMSRGAFLTLGEIKNFREAFKLEHSYENFFCSYIVILVIVNLFVIVFCRLLKYPSVSRVFGKRLLMVRIGALLLTVIGYFLIYVVFLRNIYVTALIYNDNMGAFVTLNESFFDAYYTSEAEDQISEIVASYESEKAPYSSVVHKPNIIVIMSEAFWDTNYFIDKIKIDKDPMVEFYEIADEAISGECAVDIWGGGTIMSEWEFNTGCYNGNPYSIPLAWYELERDKYFTLVSYLREQGYFTMAFHGYDGTYYGRNVLYPNMGFDVFYDLDDFVHDDTYNGYISDKSMVEEIEYRYEEHRREHGDMPIYVFSVSIQNHIFNLEERGIDAGDPANTISVSISDPDVSEQGRAKLEKFVNGIALSNEALKELTDYFNKCEEDTMIILFGDHAPSIVELGTDIYNEEHKYKTPYIIWTNYDNDYYNPGSINLSYLSTVMLDYLNMPDVLLTKKNKYLMNKYKINTFYEKASATLNEEEKEEYMKDMYNEKVLYGYYTKKHRNNAFLWDVEGVK